MLERKGAWEKILEAALVPETYWVAIKGFCPIRATLGSSRKMSIYLFTL